MAETLDNSELFNITEKLYKYINPKGKVYEIPIKMYVVVINLWYPEYINTDTEISFYDWCILNKKKHNNQIDNGRKIL